MNTVIFNGKKISFKGNAIIDIRKDMSEKQEKTDISEIKNGFIINIEGNLSDLIIEKGDIVVNGNVGNAMTRNGNITCNKASGKIICDKLEASDIRGYVNTMGDVITDNFIGNTSVGEVIDNLIPIEESEIKEGTSIYHKKYGKGKIGYYYGHNHVSVNFEEGGYKSFQKDKVMANKSFFKLKQNNIHKAYDYESEMVSKF